MIILIGLAILVIVGAFLMSDYDYEDMGFGIFIMSLICLLIALIIWPVSYYDNMAQIEKYYALERTLESSREKEQLEDAALMLKVVENNTTLASLKYWNKTIFDIYIPDEIENLKELK